MKICQSRAVKGILIFERKIKISQFADDTNLLCSDLKSVEKDYKSQWILAKSQVSGLI